MTPDRLAEIRALSRRPVSEAPHLALSLWRALRELVAWVDAERASRAAAEYGDRTRAPEE